MSKELEALEKIKDIIREDAEDIDNPTLLSNEINIIETALKDHEKITGGDFHIEPINVHIENQKKIKALEIIKEKEVDVFIFLHSGDLETYNDIVEDNRKLTQEEYYLLKEILL